MRGSIIMVLAAAACSDGGATTVDATTEVDGAPVDAPTIDASTIDGEVADAAVDAGIDAAPLRCAATTELVMDVAPRRIRGSAAVGAMLYVSTYDPDDSAGGGAVVAVAMSDLAVSPVATTASVAVVRGIDGWLYVADPATPGTVWRYQPGQPIETLASGRSAPIAVTADATNVYWFEGSQSTPTIMRAPLAGGAPSPIASAAGYQLAVDDQRLYAAELAGPVRGFRKDNWFLNWGSESVLVNVGMVLDGGELIVVDDHGVHAVRPPATMFTSLATSPSLKRRHGMTLHANHLWVTAGFQGVQRVPRAGGSFEQVTSIYADGDPNFSDGYLTWSSDAALYRCRPF